MKLSSFKVLTFNVLSANNYGLDPIHILQVDNSGFSERKENEAFQEFKGLMEQRSG